MSSLQHKKAQGPLSVEEEFVYKEDFMKQVRDGNKSWLVGSKEKTEVTMPILFDKLTLHTLFAAPALLKICDETIENCIDHWKRCANDKYKEDLTLIKVDFTDDGEMTVYNNGSGIPTKYREDAKMHNVELIFSKFGNGSNNRDMSESTSIGTNGLGIKAVNLFSDYFTVETDDGVNHYKQTWKQCLDMREDPIVTKSKGRQFTCITFKPAFVKHFDCASVDEAVDTISDWLYTRVVYMNIYLNYSVRLFNSKGNKAKHVKVMFNDELIKINTIEDLAQGLGTVISTKMISSDASQYNWDVAAVILDEPSKINTISCVNGAVIYKGKHLEKIKKLLNDSIKDKIEKIQGNKENSIKASYFMSNAVILACCDVANPQWPGQRKDELNNSLTQFKNYMLDEKFLKSFYKQIEEIVLVKVFENKIKEDKKEQKKLDMSKCDPAQNCSKSPKTCMLFLPEGLSASDTIKKGLVSSQVLKPKDCGVLDLGGVIINCRKECKFKTLRGKEYIDKSEKLEKNNWFNVFLKETGLDLNAQYDPKSKTYAAEIKALRYGKIIGCVDQDLDGFNIFGLILNIFDTFWPNLIDAGYVYKLNTPVIRAYPKTRGQAIDFYNKLEFEEWKSKNNADLYKIKYYKGLGTNDDLEIKWVFNKFDQSLYQYKYKDEDDEENVFELYYGRSSQSRKLCLKNIPKTLSDDMIRKQSETLQITCEDELSVNVHEYQRDNIARKLNGIDGLNQSRRMCLNSIFKKFVGDKRGEMEPKISELGGFITEHENYHHGAASIEGTLKHMAFLAVGGNQIPILLPKGNFGSRRCGGKGAASSRYIFCNFNHRAVDLMYAKADYYDLIFNYDDNKRGEPKYFIPIMPPVLEFVKLPATGWKVELFARDFTDTLKCVRGMIEGDSSYEVAPWLHGFTGKYLENVLMSSDDIAKVPSGALSDQYSDDEDEETNDSVKSYKDIIIGKYEIKKNSVIITELPIRVWSGTYKKHIETKLKKLDWLVGVWDYTTGLYIDDDEKVKIEIALKPGIIDKLKVKENKYGLDPIIYELDIYSIVSHCINFIDTDGRVAEYEKYHQVIDAWFPKRKEQYAIRLTKERLLLELRIVYLENYTRYIQDNTVKIKGLEESQANKILADAKYLKLDPSVINAPKFRNCEAITEEFYAGNYDYLLDTTDRNKLESSVKKKLAELTTKRKELADLNKLMKEDDFIGKTQWLKELAELEKVYNEGIKTKWLFGEFGKYTNEVGTNKKMKAKKNKK